MPATKLTLTSKNNGKTVTENITYANPAANDENLATFMGALVNLSQNEFVSLDRVNTHRLTIPNQNQSE